MLSNVKLPHWAMVLVSLVSLIVAWVIRQDASGAISVPAVVLGVLPIVQTVLGMLSPAVSPTTNAVAAKLAARRAAGVAGMLTLCFVLAGAWACQACSAAQKTQEVTLGVDTLVCVLNHNTDPPPTIALECGVSDLTQIATILNAQKAAEIRDLYGDGGVKP